MLRQGRRRSGEPAAPQADRRDEASAHPGHELQVLVGNRAVQGLFGGEPESERPSTMRQLIDPIGEIMGAPPPPDMVIEAILRESPDAGLAFYLEDDTREKIRMGYHPPDQRRIFAALLRKPYVPGIEALLYDALSDSDAAAFAEVNDETNLRFAEETGVVGPLDWSNEEERPLARRWLMLRDEVMAERIPSGGPDDDVDEDEGPTKSELIGLATRPGDLHTTLRGLSAERRADLIGDETFLGDLRDALGDWDEFTECIEDLGGRAPTGKFLAFHTPVVKAVEAAWDDSNPDAGALATKRSEIGFRNHEEGGWIYLNVVTGAFEFRRQSAEDSTFFETDEAGNTVPWIDLEHPPELDDCVLVANFHTHPNEDRYAEPSAADSRTIASKGVPGLLRDSKGLGAYGPERRASLSGPQGYPG